MNATLEFDNDEIIPLPEPVDKDKSNNENLQSINSEDCKENKTNKPDINDIIEKSECNINNYKKGETVEIIYTEEKLDHDMKYLNYDNLLNVLNIEKPYNPSKFKEFIYKNYNPNNSLIFNSQFESGNLRYALKHSENEYDLIIRPESNCFKNYQWFYFLVKINDKVSPNFINETPIVKFNIINLIKKNIIFSEDVKILSYYNNCWSRDTSNIFYFTNSIPILYDTNFSYNNFQADSNCIDNYFINRNFSNNNINLNNNLVNINNSIISNNNNTTQSINGIYSNQNNNVSNNTFHTLSFSFDFSLIKTNKKYVYFAYCYPYTYTQLDKFLCSLNQLYKDILRFDELGRSIDNNIVHILIITNFNDSFDILAKKKAIILTGRVHPGESNSSYVIEGLIQFLLSKDPIAENLRKFFIFKIVPMLNPDGVIRGNFRMNALGRDLNRSWVDTQAEITPTIYNCHQMIQKTLNSRDIYLFCDFHGHSNKKNFFIYSCKSKSDFIRLSQHSVAPNLNRKKFTFHELVFIELFTKENKYFDKSSCVDKIIPSKLRTARAVLKMKYHIDLSYCLESSMAAVQDKGGNVNCFTIKKYKNIGHDFCIIISKLIQPKIYFSTLNFIRQEKKDKDLKKIKEKEVKDKLKKEVTKIKNKELVLPMINNSNLCSVRINTSAIRNFSASKKDYKNNNPSSCQAVNHRASEINYNNKKNSDKMVYGNIKNLGFHSSISSSSNANNNILLNSKNKNENTNFDNTNHIINSNLNNNSNNNITTNTNISNGINISNVNLNCQINHCSQKKIKKIIDPHKLQNDKSQFKFIRIKK